MLAEVAAMLEFFTMVGDALSTLFAWIGNIFSGLLSIFGLFGSVMSFNAVVIGWLPPAIFAFATLGVGVAIVLFIIGR